MKKTIALILILAMCLSLWACGGDEPSGTVPENVPGVQLPNETDPAGGGSSDATTGSHISNHPWMEKLYGTWEHDSEIGGCPGTITINEDGTCVFGGGVDYTEQSYNWWVSEEGSSDELLKIIVDKGTEKAWMLELRQTNDLMEYSISLWHHEFDGLYTPYGGYYCNMQNMQISVEESSFMAVREKEGMPVSIALHADQTCTVDGKTYGWQTRINSNYSDFSVIIMDGESELYQMNFHSDNGTCTVESGDSSLTYMDMATYERVELTPENWSEYFELVENLNISKNAFGDFKQFDIGYRYDLKDSYFARLYDNANEPWYNHDAIALEVQYIGHYADYTIDVENNTYTVSNLHGGELVTTVCSSTQEREYFRLYIKSVGGPEVSGTTWNGVHGYPTDFTILRVKGYLWLTKE